ncbi:hypothetical protein D6850_10715 [Roseovarius spongiae]|uniref:Uncharacterized protein n=2 Tax=Roseovarius spongiae TaxID=2320272 RepID=A0A3A8B3H1_9RHOB|nr:hypothetical protein D6850_10715 [Roseovarius spongiae]
MAFTPAAAAQEVAGDWSVAQVSDGATGRQVCRMESAAHRNALTFTIAREDGQTGNALSYGMAIRFNYPLDSGPAERFEVHFKPDSAPIFPLFGRYAPQEDGSGLWRATLNAAALTEVIERLSDQSRLFVRVRDAGVKMSIKARLPIRDAAAAGALLAACADTLD